MFDRVGYKLKAKETLSGHWGVPVLISLIVLLVSCILSGPGTVQAVHGEVTGEYYNGAVSSGSTIISIIVSGVLELASAHFYLKFVQKRNDASFNTFLTGLTDCVRGILAVLWSFLWTMLWCLLLFVPGIIKAISYSQMYFILAEHPECSVRKSMKISMAITRGHKADLFVMYLSFLGWGLLAAITCGIGLLWLEPYMSTSLANAYLDMKDEALRTGKILPTDFSDKSLGTAGTSDPIEPTNTADSSNPTGN